MVYLVMEHEDGFVSVSCNRCKYCNGSYRSLMTAKALLRTVEGWHVTDKVAICKACVERALWPRGRKERAEEESK